MRGMEAWGEVSPGTRYHHANGHHGHSDLLRIPLSEHQSHYHLPLHSNRLRRRATRWEYRRASNGIVSETRHPYQVFPPPPSTLHPSLEKVHLYIDRAPIMSGYSVPRRERETLNWPRVDPRFGYWKFGTKPNFKMSFCYLMLSNVI